MFVSFFNHFLCVLHKTFCIVSYVFKRKLFILFSFEFQKLLLPTGKRQRDRCTESMYNNMLTALSSKPCMNCSGFLVVFWPYE